MLTLVALVTCWSDLATIDLLFFLCFHYSTLWKEVTICSLHLRSYAPTSLKSEYILQLFEILQEAYIYFLTFIYLFHHFIYQYGLMDVTFILWFVSTVTIVAQIVPTLALWSSFSCVCVCVCVYIFALVCVWVFLYFRILQDAPGSSWAFHAPVLQSTISSKEPFFFFLENGTRN